MVRHSFRQFQLKIYFSEHSKTNDQLVYLGRTNLNHKKFNKLLISPFTIEGAAYLFCTCYGILLFSIRCGLKNP